MFYMYVCIHYIWSFKEDLKAWFKIGVLKRSRVTFQNVTLFGRSSEKINIDRPSQPLQINCEKL